MRNDPVSCPDESAVVETAFDGTDDEVAELLREQPQLADLVQDVKSIKKGLESLEDEEPPPFSLEKKAHKNDRRLFSMLQDLPLEWYKNPYILSFGFVLAVLFFYFCYILIEKL
jgi:hypothetical protein